MPSIILLRLPFFWLLFLALLSGCSEEEKGGDVRTMGIAQKQGRQFWRVRPRGGDRDRPHRFLPPPPLPIPSPSYPFDREFSSITKYHFRCRGDGMKPPVEAVVGGEKRWLCDCSGAGRHSLPIREGKEFIYPVLIELLQFIQKKSGREVVITSGHRCPEHNSYIDLEGKLSYAKHQIGGGVDFYVRGWEERWKEVLALIEAYYETQRGVSSSPLLPWRRWEGNTDVSTAPWYNKELFVKLYLSHEGRNGDNCHSHPYFSLYVRWDRERNERVEYSWKEAFHGYYRY